MLLVTLLTLSRLSLTATALRRVSAEQTVSHRRIGPTLFIDWLNAMGSWCAILGVMPSRASQMIGTLALLTCLICPILETFDSWDPPIQTGNDTEYTLVIVALCTGAAYSFARFVMKSPRIGFVAQRLFAPCVQKSSLSARCFTLLLTDAASPPPLPLRI